MKLLLLLDTLRVGGTERSLVEILPHLLEAGIQPTVVSLRHDLDPNLAGEVRDLGIPLSSLSGSSFPARVKDLRRLLSHRMPDLLHSSLFEADLTARFAAAGLPLKVVNSLVNASYEPARFNDPRIRPWRLRAVQAADAVTGRFLVDHFHAVSRAAKDSAVRHLRLPSERITVVWRGRNPARLGEPSPERRRRSRRALNLPLDAPILINVGRQEFQKGQVHLLRAVKRLLPRHPDLTVLLVGRPGNVADDLDAEVKRLRLGSRVRFLGHREDVPELLAAADLFVLTSLFEGYPGVVVEAMALALPVVATDIPPVREVVEPGGSALTVASAATEPLAQALDQLLTRPDTARHLGERGRELFLTRHQTAAVAPAMVELYRVVAGEG